MLFYISYLLFLVICGVENYELSESIWSDMDNTMIDIDSYCRNKICVAKCCPADRVMLPNTSTTVKCVKLTSSEYIKKTDYSIIPVYNKKSNETKQLSTKNFISHFTFVQNDMLSDEARSILYTECQIIVLEDGSLQTESTSNKLCKDISQLAYCLDYILLWDEKGDKVYPTLVYRTVSNEDPDAEKKNVFAATGMLISSFCMMISFVVYCLLPKLQNIVGMILMAYLLSLMTTFVAKAVQLIIISTIEEMGCRILSSVIYYFILSSFFWSNVMSLDLWWTIRGSRKNRAIHRQGELVKFLWYCLYAWGTPVLILLSVLAIEKFMPYIDPHHKPPFKSCFAEKTPTFLYVHIPIGTMTIVNILLFLMTAYNIWLVRRGVSNTSESRISKNNKNRFVIYIKLLVLMGVSWILELSPELPLYAHIIVNFFNMFIGVAIFCILICKKSIIIMLLNRFGICNNFVKKLESSQRSTSKNTKSTASGKSNKCRRTSSVDQSEMAEL